MLAALAATFWTPLTDPVTWFSETDYPAVAMAKHAGGSVSVELSVEPSGIPSACKVTSPAREPSLNQATCSVMMSRARFQPQAASQFPASIPKYSQTVQWTIPASPNSSSFGGTYANFAFDHDGAVVNCRERPFGPNDLTLDSCGMLKDSTKEDLQDVFGEVVQRAIEGTIRLEVLELKKGVVPVSLPAVHLAYFVLLKAKFDILPSGRVGNCKVLTIFSDKLDNPCKALTKNPSRVPKSSTTTHLGITIDFWLDGPEKPLVREVAWARPN